MKNLLNIGTRRWLGLLIGNICIGMGVGIFKLSGLGNDPFSAMALSMIAILNIRYSTFLLLINIGLFLIEFLLGQKFVGVGTFANWFFVGYVVEFTIWLGSTYVPEPSSLMLRILYVAIGVLIVSTGLSLYQTSNAGIAPFDSMALILDDRLSKVPYFWCRMIIDGICALICLFTGGLLGFGTFVSVFCLGPIVHFLNNKVSQKLIY